MKDRISDPLATLSIAKKSPPSKSLGPELREKGKADAVK